MLIVLNNKCNFTKEFFKKYLKEIKKINYYNLILCPSTIYLSNKHLSKLTIGSQNVSKYNNGAHTGEISAKQLKSLNVNYCIIGHYERRIEEKETLLDINEKTKVLLNENIKPIICIINDKQQVLKEIEEILKDIPKDNYNNIYLAYEPYNYIKENKVIEKEELIDIINMIKEKYKNINVLYGGRINETNVNKIKEINYLDGILLGESSLEPKIVQKIVKIVKK